VHNMSSAEDRLARSTLALVPVIVAVLGCGVRLLPHDLVAQAITVLSVWLMLALPVGVIVGHCALGECDRP
jgi:hypothetical protein